MKAYSCILTVAVSLILLASLAIAQIGNSTLTGRVTDPTGATIPGAKITAINKATNMQFPATTNSEGLYRNPSMLPGTYQVTFEAAGFKKLVRDNIEIRLGEALALDATLEVGSVSESVEVKATAPLLETQVSSVQAVVPGETLYALPIYQRYVNYVLHFVPGVTTRGYAWDAQLGSYSIAGSRTGGIALYQDGIRAQDAASGSVTLRMVQNSIEDLTVVSTALPAEYGHTAGGVINVVKKTGTNQLHGLASDYGHTRSMAHRAFFDMYRTSQPGPSYAPSANWQEPDFNLSGPVYIPKIYNGKNRTFFFVAYQHMIEKLSVGSTFATVPDAAMRNGDFTFPLSPTPANLLYDPASTRQLPDGAWTRDPIPGNIIPKNRWDPVAQKIMSMNFWPLPNYPGAYTSNGPAIGTGGVTTTSGNFQYAQPSKYFQDFWSVRVDHQINPNLKLYGGYSSDHDSGFGRRRAWIVDPAFDDQTNVNPAFVQIYNAGYTWIISPTLISDARAGYYRTFTSRSILASGKNYAGLMGIPNVGPEAIPNLNAGYGLTGTGTLNVNAQEQVSFREDLTKISGKHTFKMGYDLLRMRQNNYTGGNPQGTYEFAGGTAALQPNGVLVPRTGNDFAGFLLGYAMSASFSQPLASSLPRSIIHSFYFQDDWRFSPNLTFNLGLRYSNESPVTTKWGQQSNYDPNATDDVTGLKGAIIHGPNVRTNRDNNNFQPRVGLAWHFGPKWVFRGGFALSTMDRRLRAWGFDEYSASVTQQRPVGDPRPMFQLSQGPAARAYQIRPDGTAKFVGANPTSRSATYIDPNLRNAYQMNWNFSIQRELSPRYVVEFLYQGSAGVGLFESWPINEIRRSTFDNASLATLQDLNARYQYYRPLTNWGSLSMQSNQGHSTYHGGSVRLEKRFSSGMTFQTYYTFSKAIDQQRSDFAGGGVDPLGNQRLEKGVGDYNRSHVWNGAIIYELPMGKGKPLLNRGGIWNHVFGRFEIGLVQTFQTGNPMTITFVNSPYNYLPSLSNRASVVKDGKLSMLNNWRDVGGDRFVLQNRNPTLDINWFKYPAAYTLGTLGRSTISGPGMRWSQVSVKKSWSFTERVSLQLRWDFNNVLHTFNFANPTTSVDFQNPRNFAKIGSEPGQASHGGLPLMNLALQLTW